MQNHIDCTLRAIIRYKIGGNTWIKSYQEMGFSIKEIQQIIDADSDILNTALIKRREQLKKYQSADQSKVLEMMNSYNDYMKKYDDTLSKFQALEDSDLSTEEAFYYAEVSNRITAKLLEIGY